MREFLILIGELVFIALLQTIIESALDEEKRNHQKRVVNIACVIISYALLVRYVYNHLLEDLMALVQF